jgi:hypothetical protein
MKTVRLAAQKIEQQGSQEVSHNVSASSAIEI